MIIEQIPVGGDRNFAYLIGDEHTRQAAAVDPGPGPELVVGRSGVIGLEIRYILNTHGHPDHSGGNPTVVRLTRAKVAFFGGGDVPLQDGASIRLGNVEIRTLHTPGHTLDSVCFLTGNDLVTGDTLFVGKIGGTEDEASALLEYHALHEKLCTLPPETRVWPGHDYGVRPSSTIGEELKTNPFLLCPDFASFLDLKNNWAEYKRKHGIK